MRTISTILPLLLLAGVLPASPAEAATLECSVCLGSHTGYTFINGNQTLSGTLTVGNGVCASNCAPVDFCTTGGTLTYSGGIPNPGGRVMSVVQTGWLPGPPISRQQPRAYDYYSPITPLGTIGVPVNNLTCGLNMDFKLTFGSAWVETVYKCSACTTF